MCAGASAGESSTNTFVPSRALANVLFMHAFLLLPICLVVSFVPPALSTMTRALKRLQTAHRHFVRNRTPYSVFDPSPLENRSSGTGTVVGPNMPQWDEPRTVSVAEQNTPVYYGGEHAPRSAFDRSSEAVSSPGFLFDQGRNLKIKRGWGKEALVLIAELAVCGFVRTPIFLPVLALCFATREKKPVVRRV